MLATSVVQKTRYPSPILAAMMARCPQCGAGKLFAGFLEVTPQCSKCQARLADIDAGDGAVAFVVTIAGFVVVGLAVLVEVAYQPPYWVHAALWLPLAIALPLALMRPFKGFFIGLHYRHDHDRPGPAANGS